MNIEDGLLSRGNISLALAAIALLLATALMAGGLSAQEAEPGSIPGLTLTSDSPGELVISWSDPDPAPSDYRIAWAPQAESYLSYRAENETDRGNAYPDGADRSYTVDGLPEGAEYKVQMRARFDQAGSNPWSGPWASATVTLASATEDTSETTTDPTPEPTADPTPTETPVPTPTETPVPTPTEQPTRGTITGLTLASDAAGELTASWNAPADYPNDYRVVWAKAGESWPSWRDDDRNAFPTEPSLTITGLDPGAEYRVRVRGRFNQDGVTPWFGPWATATITLASVPEPTPTPTPVASDVVTGLTLTSVADREMTITWNAPADSADDYRVIWAKVGEPSPSWRDDDGNAYPEEPSLTIAGLELGAEYRVQVRARFNQGGDNPRSGPWATATMTLASAETFAPSDLTAAHDSCGVNLAWSGPSTDADQVTGYRVLRGASGTTLTTLVANTSSTGTDYYDSGAARGSTYTYAVQGLRDATASAQSNTVEVSVPANPIGTEVEVTAVPIVVTSTTNDYFVLYAKYDSGDDSKEMPVAVVRGQAGTTTLSENVPALPTERYRVVKYPVSNPADGDGDCVDDLTELDDSTGLNPVNPTGRDLVGRLSLGASAIPDHATFERLAFQHKGTWTVKFVIIGLDTDKPALYFSDTTDITRHTDILFKLGLVWNETNLRGTISYRGASGTSSQEQGLYSFTTKRNLAPRHALDSLDVVERVYALLAASMPVVDDDLAYRISNDWLPELQPDLASYQESRVILAFDDERHAEASFIPLNAGEGYGLLRQMGPDERPGPRDVVIYESLPNELPRVAGILTTVPQTPLSHVNLRAKQDSVPNAYVRDALSDSTISGLIGRPVYFSVTNETWQMRAATLDEVNAHFDSSRPTTTQQLPRDLTVTAIKPFSEIDFDSRDAFGVKASNLAVLGTLGFPAGTVPAGYAIPFHFYNEFMKQPLGEETLFGKRSWPDSDKLALSADTTLSEAVDAILAHPSFQADVDIQVEMLDDLRDAIEDADSPQWIIDALTAMHANYPTGQSLRYRSSTNNEDLPGFNGAGLYGSKTQKPSETEEDGIDKSLKQVYASLWNYRAFAERDFNRVDHLTVAIGVAVHPNYKDELVNGVVVSVDPMYGFEDGFYVNSQVGEDLVTNPEAESTPEELLLYADGDYTVLATSNLASPGQLLMTDAQLSQLQRHLKRIHDHFAGLYNPDPSERFAMEIEFKITSDNILAIKQARPWIFSDPPEATTTGSSDATGLTARFENPPATHDGSQFDVDIVYSAPIQISFTEMEGPAFRVTGGQITRAARREFGNSAHWYIQIEPDGDGDVTIVEVPHRACTVRGAICTSDGERLSTRLELVVRGS